METGIFSAFTDKVVVVETMRIVIARSALRIRFILSNMMKVMRDEVNNSLVRTKE